MRGSSLPSNEERREVAERLRNTEIDNCGLTFSAHLGEAIGECVRLVSGHECLVEGGLNRLADLIEPEPERTCRIERTSMNEFGIYDDLSCGHVHIRQWDSLPSYCPSCGAKVVSE